MRSCYLLVACLFSLAATAQTTIFDFEGGAPTFNDFNGSVSMVIANPDSTMVNPSDSVVQNFVPGSAAFAGVNIPQTVDFANGQGFTMQVWSPVSNVDVLLKLENGTNDKERAVAFTGEAGSWQELTFDFSTEAEDIVFTSVTVFLNFNVVDTLDRTYFWDNLVQGEATSTVTQVDLPITFEDDNTDYDVVGFGGANVSIVTDPEDEDNTVGQVVKTAGAEVWGGIVHGAVSGLANEIPFTAEDTKLTVRTWSPAAGVNVRLKVENEDNDQLFAEVDQPTTVAGGWETLTFDFSDLAGGNLDLDVVYDKVALFFNFGVSPTADETYYYDDIAFVAPAGNAPTTAAPTPDREAANVISLFSNAYDDVTVDTWRTPWSESDFVDVQIDGNDTKRYTNLNFVGVETIGSPINLEADSMTHYHLDFWTNDMDSLRLKLVDFLGDGFAGANGDTEDELAFAATRGQWVSLDIPLEDFDMAAQSDINQLLFISDPQGGTVFIDNVYFYREVVSSTQTPRTGLLRVFPNPATDRVNITAPVRMQSVKLFDVSGRQVGDWTANAERFDLDVSQLKPGVYVALVQTTDGPLTVRIMRN